MLRQPSIPRHPHAEGPTRTTISLCREGRQFGTSVVLSPWSEQPAVGIAIQVDAKDGSTQTPPLLSRLIQGHLDGTGIEACPRHKMDHRVRDPDCDHCKRALGPLYRHKIKGNRHLPVFTSDFSGPHPHHVNAAQLVCVKSLFAV